MKRIFSMFVYGVLGTFLWFFAPYQAEAKTAVSLPTYWKGFATAKMGVVPVEGRPYKTWMVVHEPHPGRSLYVKVSSRGELLYFCQKDPHKEEGPNDLCLVNMNEPVPKERILLDRNKKNERDITRYQAIEGDWLLLLTNHQEFKLRNLKTGAWVFVGKVQIKSVDNEMGPFSNMSGNKVVWVDEYIDKKTGRRNAVKLFDIKTRKTKTLFEAPSDYDIDHVALDGNHLVYSLVDLRERMTKGIVHSNVYYYDISKNTHLQLKHDGSASQCEIAWPYVAWKTSVLYNWGGIYLYNIETGKGKELVQGKTQFIPPEGYHFPHISNVGVVWDRAEWGFPVYLYNLTTKTKETMDPKGTLPSLSGHYMSWRSHSDPRCPGTEDDLCTFFSDLSAPMPKDEIKQE